MNSNTLKLEILIGITQLVVHHITDFFYQAAVSTSKLRNTQQEKKKKKKKKKAFSWHYIISFPGCKFQHIKFQKYICN